MLPSYSWERDLPWSVIGLPKVAPFFKKKQNKTYIQVIVYRLYLEMCVCVCVCVCMCVYNS